MAARRDSEIGPTDNPVTDSEGVPADTTSSSVNRTAAAAEDGYPTTTGESSDAKPGALHWDPNVQQNDHHVYESQNTGRRKSSITNPNFSNSGLVDPTRRKSSLAQSTDRKGSIAALAASRSEKGSQFFLTPDQNSSSANPEIANSSSGLIQPGERRRSSVMDMGDRKDSIRALAASRSEKGSQRELMPDRRSSSANPEIANTSSGLIQPGERRRSSIMEMDRKSAIARLASSRSEKGSQRELLPDKFSSSEQPAFGQLNAFDPDAGQLPGSYESAKVDPRIDKSGSHFTTNLFGGGSAERRGSEGLAPDESISMPIIDRGGAHAAHLHHPPLERIQSADETPTLGIASTAGGSGLGASSTTGGSTIDPSNSGSVYDTSALNSSIPSAETGETTGHPAHHSTLIGEILDPHIATTSGTQQIAV